jgi:hypothetical protein
MTQLIIKETRELIQAGEIAEAEANLVVIAEQEGDHALVEVLDEMAPKDVLAVMREFDASKESIINLVVSPEQFVQAIVLERQYGEPIEKYVPRLRNTMNAVMHRNPGACAEVLECLAEHDEGVRVLADYFTDHYDSLQALAYHGVFEAELDLEKAFAPSRRSPGIPSASTSSTRASRSATPSRWCGCASRAPKWPTATGWRPPGCSATSSPTPSS